MPVLDFSERSVAEEDLPDFSDRSEEVPDFSDRSVPAEVSPKKAALLAEQRTAQREGKLADVAVGAASVAEGVGQGLSQMNPITAIPRLGFEVERKLGLVPAEQENPFDANRPMVSPQQLRDLTSLSLPEPGTTGEGVKQFAAEFISGLTSPNMVMAMAAAPLTKGAEFVTQQVVKLLGPAFAGDVISHAPDAYQDYLQSLRDGDQAEIAKSALNLTATVVIPAAIARHAYKATRPGAPADELPPLREAELRQQAADTALANTLPMSAKAAGVTGKVAEPVPPGFTTELGGPIEAPKPYVEPIKAETPRPTAIETPEAPVAAEAKATVGPKERVAEAPGQEAVVGDVEPTVEARVEPTVTKPTPPAAAEAKIQAEVKNVAETEGIRPAKDIKEELVSRIQGELDALREGAKVQVIPREGAQEGEHQFVVVERDGARLSGVSIDQTKNGFEVTIGKGRNKGRFRTKTREEAIQRIQELHSTGEGKITIEIPGDGVFTVFRDGKSLSDLLARAKRIETSSTGTPKIKKEGVPTRAEGRAFLEEARVKEEPTELSQTSKPAVDPWERAKAGDEKAWSDLEQEFRDRLGEPEELAAGSGGRSRVLTAEAFERLFNDAYKDRDFDRILAAVKANDLAVYKLLIQKFFKAQKADPTAAAKAEWMRAVFNGTRPADAKAPAAAPPPRPTPPPPPPPRPGAQPGGGITGAPPPGAPPPAPPPQRIPVSPIPGGGAKAPSVILEDFAKAIGKAIKVRRQKRSTLGTYAPGSTLTTERFSGDLDTAAHELAGHWVDDKYGIAKPWFTSRQRSPYDAELSKFWIHGSATPGMSLRYKRAEGVAEFARAYVMNPAEAMREAPLFGAYFERTLPPEGLKAVKAFSEDVRRWAGEDPLRQGGLDIRMDPPTLREKLWRTISGRGYGFETNWLDKLREKFDDPYHYAVKGFHKAAEARGKNTPLTLEPKENFELMARLLASHDTRMTQQYEHGLVPLEPKQVQGPKGLEVERIKDPVTGKAMNLEWLMEPFDTSSVKTMKADQLETAAYMVAQRTLEKSDQTGKQSGISGAGHGIYTDVNRAKALIARVESDPALRAKLDESARRYRLWADQNIRMLVDSGRLSAAQARDIKNRNEFYVDMHRLSEEFDFQFKQQRSGGSLGSATQPIQKFKGSALEVNNVYANLLSQTDAIQKEAHRNMVMRDYTDMLTQARSMHQGPVVDLDQFGSRARAGDRNTIPVYRLGKRELWKFAPEIHSSLKGLGDMSTNPSLLWRGFTAPSRIARYLITHSPAFAVRNVIRDTMARTVISRQNSLPWDVLKGYTKEELSRYEVFGGGQFGNYIRDRTTWNRVMKDKMQEMSKDPKNIFLSPVRLWQGWDKMVQASEKAGRVAEFRRAFERGKKEFGYDDYNAALYAAGEARGLMDFAKMGTVMRDINQVIPFSNAAIRGLAREFTAAKEKPVRFALRWTSMVMVPTIAALLWNKRDPEVWEEYQQLPAYQRDMFWNIKVGDHWLRIPKPHLLGVMAGGVERAYLRAEGDTKSMEGFTKNLAASSLPVSDPAELLGPIKTMAEVAFNRDTFRDREIVPFYESQLKPELRKGEKYASKAGLGIAQVLRAAGLTTDARQVDHVLNSYGGLGQMVTSATDTKRPLSSSALQATGLVTQSPTTAARDYQWVMDWARKNGQTRSADIAYLTELRNAVFEAKSPEEKQAKGKKLREAASKMRDEIERREK